MEAEIILKIISESIKEAKKGSFLKREVYKNAIELLPSKQIISIVGVRRCGKSTLLKELVRIALTKTSQNNILYLNLEHPFFNQYKNDVKHLHEIYSIFFSKVDNRKKIFIFLDEIQFFQDWQVFIKWLYEKNVAKIVITGSNSRLLSSELATILSGRTIPVHVYPFSLSESKLSFNNYLNDGGFPEVVLNPKIKSELAETYYKNILYQDVIPRFNVKNSIAMENLSYYLISNIGKELSYNTLKTISNLDDKTVKEYISYLQDANLLYVLHNYDFSLKKLIGNKKKIYVVDPLFTQLSFKNSPDLGRLFENFIYMHLRRNKFSIFFHKNGGECDFIIKQGFKISNAIQVCFELSSENQERELNGLISAMEKFELKKGYIVTQRQNQITQIDEKIIEIISINNFIEKIRN